METAAAERHLDLHTGERRESRPPAAVQQLGPYLVKDPNTAWVGMEFFCNETDDFWKMPDEKDRRARHP